MVTLSNLNQCSASNVYGSRGGNHFIANTAEVENERLRPNIDVHELVGSMSVAWLKLFLDGEEEYREMLFGDMPSEVTQQLSRFEYHK